MIHFDLPKEQSSIIKVIGIGGGGSNAVNHMYSDGIEGVDFIICNTDAQALENSPVPNKIQLGPHLTQGLGAGANPEIGKLATEESLEEIRRILEVNTKMVFITVGMGGGTGTGGAPIIARICQELGILTVGIVTTPFSYEGKKRLQQAQDGILNLKDHVDTLLIISNDKLRHQFGNLHFKAAFAKADNILAIAAKCITDIINQHGHINVDFADVCTAMRRGGVAILGSAMASGEDRAQKAISLALASPLLNDNNIHGAKWILLNITSGEGDFEHTIDEMDTIQAYIQSKAGEDCDVILGAGYGNNLGECLGVTIIATGFDQIPFQSMTQGSMQKAPEKVILSLAPEPGPRNGSGQAGQEKDREPSPAPLRTAASVPESKPMISVQLPKEPVQKLVPGLPDTADSDRDPAGIIPPGEYLSRPVQIYASTPEQEPEPPELKPAGPEPSTEMRIIYRDPDAPNEESKNRDLNPASMPVNLEETEEQKRKAVERLSRLRNMSFNIKSMETHPELETVPAYIRRNIRMEEESDPSQDLFSGYSVREPKTNTQAEISTINTFLDGKKPD